MTPRGVLGVHSHCAYCEHESVLTVGPATTWQSPGRVSQDVCPAHALQAIFNQLGDGVGMVQVGNVRSHFRGVSGHNAEHGA
jgi:hypothetical protein